MRKRLLAALAAGALAAAALPAQAAVSPMAPPSDVVINELACDTSAGEYIELANRNAKWPVAIGGWQVSDEPPATATAQHRFRIPSGTLLKPGARYVVRVGAQGLPFNLACGTDEIYLAQNLGATFSLIDEVSVPNLTAEASWGRNAAGRWQAQNRTPGAANQAISGGVEFDRAAWLFDPASEVRIDLSLDAAAEQSLREQPGEYVSAQFRLTAPDSSQLPSTGAIQVGVRLKGSVGSFLPYDPANKSALKLKFGEFVAGQRFEGLKKLTLNNMRQDPTMLREVLTYKLFRDYGIPAPRTGFANVYINGQLRGLYLLLEPYDDVSLDWWVPALRHVYDAHWTREAPFSKPEIDSWDLPRHFEVDEGDENDYSDLEQFADSIALDGPMGAEAAKRIDFAQVGAFLAIEKYVSHWDGYSGSPQWTPNNYNLMSDRFGRFTMLPWGVDQTWGYALPKESFSSAQGLLFDRCMKTVRCKDAYLASVEGLPARISGLGLDLLAQELFATHTNSRQADTLRQANEEQSSSELGALRWFISERPADVTAFLSGRQAKQLSWSPASLVLAQGSRLTADHLNGSIDTAGTLSYSHPLGTALPLGKTVVTLTWTPATQGAQPLTLKRTFTVKRAQSITVTNPGARKLSSKSLTLSAKATSGLKVSLKSNSSSVCVVSGSKVQFKKKGTCSLTASAAANSTFAAAPSVTLTFKVS